MKNMQASFGLVMGILVPEKRVPHEKVGDARQLASGVNQGFWSQLGYHYFQYLLGCTRTNNDKKCFYSSRPTKIRTMAQPCLNPVKAYQTRYDWLCHVRDLKSRNPEIPKRECEARKLDFSSCNFTAHLKRKPPNLYLKDVKKLPKLIKHLVKWQIRQSDKPFPFPVCFDETSGAFGKVDQVSPNTKQGPPLARLIYRRSE